MDDMAPDFYEDDESLDAVREAFNSSPKGVTAQQPYERVFAWALRVEPVEVTAVALQSPIDASYCWPVQISLAPAVALAK